MLRRLQVIFWLGNKKAYEIALAELVKEKDSISRERFKAKRYLYQSKIDQYKNLENTKTDNERVELLEDYLSKLVASISKDLPRVNEGVRIDSVERFDTDLIFQFTETGKSSSRTGRSVLMEFACLHRELRVALINGAQISLILDSGGAVQSILRVDETKCYAEYGSMENYGNYDMSVEPEEGSAHPKSAAWVFSAW